MNSLKKTGLVLALLAGIGTGCASTSAVTRDYPELRLEQSVEQQLKGRPYVRHRKGAEVIEYDSKYTNVQYYSFADKKVLDSKICNNQVVYEGITIEGDSTFRENTIKALELLRQRDFEDYRLVLTNLNGIVQNTNNVSESYAGKFSLIGFSWHGPLAKYAGTLAHEALHLILPQKRADEDEEKCYNKQLEVYKKLGASEDSIFALERFIKRKVWRIGYKNIFGEKEAVKMLLGNTNTNLSEDYHIIWDNDKKEYTIKSSK